MLGVERLDGIMEMLKDGQAVSIHTLSKALYISESTLRRDLAALQKEGLIRRIRGGACLVYARGPLAQPVALLHKKEYLRCAICLPQGVLIV